MSGRVPQGGDSAELRGLNPAGALIAGVAFVVGTAVAGRGPVLIAVGAVVVAAAAFLGLRWIGSR